MRTWIRVTALSVMASLPHTLAAAHQTTECIIVRNADIRTTVPQGLKYPETTLWSLDAGHRLIPGSRHVLVMRVYESDEGSADAQSFTKLTAVLDAENDPTLQTVYLKSAAFSEGYSGFAYKGDAWLADSVEASVSPTVGQTLSVHITGAVSAENALRKNRRRFEMDYSCSLENASVNELSPWQGGRGSIWSSFDPS